MEPFFFFVPEEGGRRVAEVEEGVAEKEEEDENVVDAPVSTNPEDPEDPEDPGGGIEGPPVGVLRASGSKIVRSILK